MGKWANRQMGTALCFGQLVGLRKTITRVASTLTSLVFLNKSEIRSCVFCLAYGW